MKVSAAIAHILKCEGVDVIFGYPRNAVLEEAAKAGIRPIIVRQERTGVHMADALSRLTRGRRMGVFAMQHGPGTENAYGGIAQAYSESVPVLVLPQGYARRLAYVPDKALHRPKRESFGPPPLTHSTIWSTTPPRRRSTSATIDYRPTEPSPSN